MDKPVIVYTNASPEVLRKVKRRLPGVVFKPLPALWFWMV